MDKITVDIEEFEQDMIDARRSHMLVMSKNLITTFLVIVFVIVALALPKTTYIHATKRAKTKISPYGEPIQIEMPQNIAASNLSKPEDHKKLVKVKNLNNKEVYYILPVARYSLSGRVTEKNKFFFNQSAFDKLALIDLGMVWGDMAKEEYFSKIEAHSQEQLDGSRGLVTFFNKRFERELQHLYPYLNTHSSHTHVIPANKKIMRVMNAIRAGQVVKLDGYLVDIYNDNKFRFAMTSLSRTDTNESARGGGACEVMYVMRVQVGNKIFE